MTSKSVKSKHNYHVLANEFKYLIEGQILLALFVIGASYIMVS